MGTPYKKPCPRCGGPVEERPVEGQTDTELICRDCSLNDADCVCRPI